MRTLAAIAVVVLLVLATGACAGTASARGPVRAASAAETHAIAVDIRQPRWSCFAGRIARRGPWGTLRRSGGGCPGLPWAIVVREHPERGWRELRRFPTRRAACRAKRPRLPAAVRPGLLGCAKPAYSADSSHQ